MISNEDTQNFLNLFDEKLMKPATQIQTKLTRRFLTVSDLKERLNITKRKERMQPIIVNFFQSAENLEKYWIVVPDWRGRKA